MRLGCHVTPPRINASQHRRIFWVVADTSRLNSRAHPTASAGYNRARDRATGLPAHSPIAIALSRINPRHTAQFAPNPRCRRRLCPILNYRVSSPCVFYYILTRCVRDFESQRRFDAESEFEFWIDYISWRVNNYTILLTRRVTLKLRVTKLILFIVDNIELIDMYFVNSRCKKICDIDNFCSSINFNSFTSNILIAERKKAAKSVLHVKNSCIEIAIYVYVYIQHK